MTFKSSGSREYLKGILLIWAWRVLGHETKKLVSTITKYNKYKLQTNPLHPEHLQEQDIRKAIKAKLPALFKITAKLGRAQSNAYQNKDKHRTPIMRSTLNNRSTTRESSPQNGQQPKQRGWGLKCILRSFEYLSSLHPKESPYEI